MSSAYFEPKGSSSGRKLCVPSGSKHLEDIKNKKNWSTNLEKVQLVGLYCIIYYNARCKKHKTNKMTFEVLTVCVLNVMTPCIPVGC
jgi:hypothetical protein